MVEVFTDYLPLNARVVVDYKKDDPVSFHFPRRMPYWMAFLKWVPSQIMSLWIAILIYPIIVLFLLNILLGIDVFSYLKTNSLLWLIIPPTVTIISLLFSKKLTSKVLPKVAYISHYLLFGMKERKFTARDVRNRRVNFNNLNKVEVLEYPFKYVRNHWLMPWKKFKIANDMSFCAVFHFNRNPKSGNLTVKFI